MRPTVETGSHATRSIVSTVLAGGVFGSVALMVLGALLAALQPAPAAAPAALRAILEGVAAGQGLALVQLGVVLLILTPVMRVLASVLAFAREGDWTYVLITTVVLALLSLSVVVPDLFGHR